VREGQSARRRPGAGAGHGRRRAASTRAHLDGYVLVAELQLWLFQERRQGADLAPWTRPAPARPPREPRAE
jgi:hypothetical protein